MLSLLPSSDTLALARDPSQMIKGEEFEQFHFDNLIEHVHILN